MFYGQVVAGATGLVIVKFALAAPSLTVIVAVPVSGGVVGPLLVIVALTAPPVAAGGVVPPPPLAAASASTVATAVLLEVNVLPLFPPKA